MLLANLWAATWYRLLLDSKHFHNQRDPEMEAAGALMQ